MYNIIFLDTETTGFKKPRMVQLAYKTAKYKFESLYNPERDIEKGAIEVHGITDEIVKDEDKFYCSTDQKVLQLLVDSNITVIHNAKFDLNILSIEGISVSKYICTYQCCLKILNRNNIKGNNTLQNLKKEFKLDILEGAKAHDAMGDVLVLEQLFYYILNQMKDMSIEEKVQQMIEISL